jgi:peptidoglycan hydrolase CwlO-like protein
MADDVVDFRLLGQLVQKVQVDVRDLRTDVRDLRSKQLRLEGDVASLRTSMEIGFETLSETINDRISRLEAEMRAGFSGNEAKFRSIDARFEQMAHTAATNLQIVLAAIEKK